MINIKINEDYRVTSDPLNYMLQERYIIQSGKNKGEPAWKTLGYHTTLEQTLMHYLEYGVKNSNAENIVELSDTINNIKKEIREVLKCMN